MGQSATYQAIVRRGLEQGLAEGRAEGMADGERRMLLVVGEAKFGAADAAVQAAIDMIGDLAWLEAMAVRLLDVGSWEELLATPRRAARRQSNRKDSPPHIKQIR
jgi:hypothetical protein